MVLGRRLVGFILARRAEGRPTDGGGFASGLGFKVGSGFGENHNGRPINGD
jgi:hypothetical protein